jgi:hypothetical protein
MKLRQFFTENNDRLSMTRLLSFILVVGGVVLAFVHPDYEGLSLGMIALGLGAKVGQKSLEGKRDAKGI